VRVRKALSCALDRQRILEVVLDNEGVLINSPFPPGHWALAGGGPSIPSYDPAYARSLLEQAGWGDKDGDGFLEKNDAPLRVSVAANGENPIRVKTAMLAVQYYRAIGVDAEAHIVEWGNLLEKLFLHNYQAAVFSWPFNPDPDQTLFFASDEAQLKEGFNFVSYANSRADALLREGLRAPGCAPDMRAQAYGELALLLAEERPYDFLFAPYTLTAVREEALPEIQKVRGVFGG